MRPDNMRAEDLGGIEDCQLGIVSPVSPDQEEVAQLVVSVFVGFNM